MNPSLAAEQPSAIGLSRALVTLLAERQRYMDAAARIKPNRDAVFDQARIDDVVFAQSYASSETPCVGRWAALQAGLPVQVPGMQLDRRCGKSA